MLSMAVAAVVNVKSARLPSFACAWYISVHPCSGQRRAIVSNDNNVHVQHVRCTLHGRWGTDFCIWGHMILTPCPYDHINGEQTLASGGPRRTAQRTLSSSLGAQQLGRIARHCAAPSRPASVLIGTLPPKPSTRDHGPTSAMHAAPTGSSPHPVRGVWLACDLGHGQVPPPHASPHRGQDHPGHQAHQDHLRCHPPTRWTARSGP